MFIGSVPRLELAHLPTPLEELKTLSAELGGPRILIKRDDQTGLAFGGNKARKLEYIFADAVAKGADVIITWGGLQSNWCRQTAAAAAMSGIRSILLLSKPDDAPVVTDGNLLLDEILGADVRILEPGSNQAQVAEKVAEEERAKGIRVAEWLVEQKVDLVFLRESLRGKGPVYVFGDAGVEMRETEAPTLEEALEEARKEDVR